MGGRALNITVPPSLSDLAARTHAVLFKKKTICSICPYFSNIFNSKRLTGSDVISSYSLSIGESSY